MKTKIYSSGIIILLIIACNKSNAQYAKKDLSNLTSPTAVNVNLLPDKDGKRNLGNINIAWKNLYLDTAIYISGHRFLSGRIGSFVDNTAVGQDALNSNTGASNTAVGYNALYSNTTGGANTAVGLNAMYFNTTGANNTATGLNALYKNTTGGSNTATGIYSMSSNTTGSSNAAFGNQALYVNTTASYNTALGTFSLVYNNADGNTAAGYSALLNNTTGYNNVAIGISALQNNTVGHNLVAVGDSALFHQSGNIDDFENTAVGSKALYSNTTGYANTANGSVALYSNTTGVWNTAVGTYALYGNTTGDFNTAIGHGALLNNTTGEENTAAGMQALSDNTIGGNNSAYGGSALTFNTTGSDNTGIGWGALGLNTTGSNNTATGWDALGSNTTGGANTVDGFNAGYNITDGSYNTFVGTNANCGSGGHLSNSTAIGNGATVTVSNNFVFGNSSVVKWGFGKVAASGNIIDFVNTTAKLTTGGTWTNASDKKLKNNFQKLDKQDILDKINSLDIERWHYIADGSPITHIGPVAQDFYAAFKVGDDTTTSTIDPAGIALLGIQQLKKENDDLKAEVEELKTLIVSIQKTYASCNPCAAGNNSSYQSSKIITSDGASLEQNIPNPFSNTTTINYNLPQQFSSAEIIITDKSGHALKTIALSNNKGSVNVDASTLSSGAYQYSLIVDGKLIDSKQMEQLK